MAANDKNTAPSATETPKTAAPEAPQGDRLRPDERIVFSIFPMIDLVLEAGRYEKRVDRDGHIEKFILNPTRMASFEHNRCIVSDKELEQVKKHRRYGIEYWEEKELRTILKNPAQRDKAKWLRKEIERRRALVDQTPDADIMEILDGHMNEDGTINRGKMGKVVSQGA